MTFDEWTTEARRSLEAWQPEPAIRPIPPLARSGVGDGPLVDLVPTTDYASEPTPSLGRRRPSTGRRVRAAVAAAAVVAAVALAAVAIPSGDADDTDLAVEPRSEPTPPGAPAADTSEPSGTSEPTDPAPAASSAPIFDCSEADPAGGGSTAVFDASSDVVAEWRVGDIDGVQGTLVDAAGEDPAATAARAAAFVDGVAPGWRCTVWSPAVDVSDPSRPGPQVVDDVVTNRLGGMCLVPDALASPGSVWGVDPALAAALDQVDGLTTWNVILADGHDNIQDPSQRWMEFTFEADPSLGDSGATTGVLDRVTAAVAAAGAAAGVPTRCSVH